MFAILMTMNTVVILRGPSGVGKSTISQIIQEKCGPNWTVIDVDKLKHYMPLKEGKTNRAERTEIAHDVAQYFTKAMYDKGYNVILEEMYRKDHNDRIVRFLRENDMRYIKVFLSAPLEDVLQRSSSRQEKNVPESEIRRLYEETQPYPDDLLIDTSKHSSEEAANLIVQQLKSI